MHVECRRAVWNNIEIIAHRGASAACPENTMIVRTRREHMGI